MFAEFDPVPHQIKENLAQPPGVAPQPGGHFGADFGDKLKVLVAAPPPTWQKFAGGRDAR
jgi:hypothetical protein